MNKISIWEIKTTIGLSNNYTLSKEVDKTSALQPQSSLFETRQNQLF
jgi:hypothetical protein